MDFSDIHPDVSALNKGKILRFVALSLLILCFRAGNASGGVLSDHTAVRCSAAPEKLHNCDSIKTSAFEGKFATLIGLDGSFSSKFSENARLTYESSSSSSAGSGPDQNTVYFRLKDSLGFRFGPSIRLHIFDTVGLAFDAGYHWSSLGTESDEEQSNNAQSTFSIGYGGAYVGGTIFLPVQKVDKLGFLASFRNYLVSEGGATMRLPYAAELNFKAKPIRPVKEMSVGFFGSVFYISYSIREEGWKIAGASERLFSEITSRASGVELGIGGPIWYVWP